MRYFRIRDPTTTVQYGNNYSVDTGEEGKEWKDKRPSGHRTWYSETVHR